MFAVKWFEALHKTVSIGVEESEDVFYIAKLSYSRGRVSIVSLDKRAKEGDVKPLYMEECVCVTAVDARDVLVRSLDLAITKQKDVDAVVPFQSETLIPYPVENAILQWTSQKVENGTDVSVYAVRKDHLSSHLATWHKWQVEPEVVVSTQIALLEFARLFVPQQDYLYWVHVESQETTCLLLHEGKVLAAKAIPKTINIVTEEELRLEISRTLFAMGKMVKRDTVQEIAFSGNCLSPLQLPEVLCKALNLRRKYFTIPEGILVSLFDLEMFAIPIGAALCVLPSSHHKQNFRQKEFVHPHPWKRLKKPLIAYFGLCAIIAISAYLFTLSYTNYELARLRQAYGEFLVLLNKPYTEAEAKFSQGEKEIPIAQLSAADIAERLNFWEKETQAVPVTYPFVPGVPRVSDVLAWLSTHPYIVGLSADEENAADAIRLESFSYSMVKRPENAKKNERYQVKVDLEFTSPTPKAAREFHDALISPNAIVDPKSEVKWSTNRGKYNTSFMLKDRTTYIGQ